MKKLTSLALSALLLMGISAQPAYTAEQDQPEFILASLNAGRRVNADDVTIQRFRYLLSSIQQTSGETPSRIADKVAKGRDLVRSHYGKNVSLLSFTEDTNRAMRAAPEGHL